MKDKSAIKKILDAFDDGKDFVLAFVRAELTDLDGEQKKKIAVMILNELIDVPIMPESVEEMIIEWLIDFGIDMLNKALGHEWIHEVHQDVKLEGMKLKVESQ